MEEFQNVISTLGFPIAAYVALFWYMTKRDSEHKEEVTKLTEAINNNTLALQHLTDTNDNYDGKH